MKKLLSTLGVIAVVGSSVSTVTSCSNGANGWVNGQAKMDTLENTLNGNVSSNFAAGYTVTVAKDGKTIYQYKNGLMDYGNKVEMKKDAKFKVMSMTKPMTAASFLMLWNNFKTFTGADGKEKTITLKESILKDMWSEWDKKILTLIDKSAAKDDITLFQVLTMTSGIDYASVDSLVNNYSFFHDWKNNKLSMDGFAKNLATVPLFAEPGTKWHYGFNMDILGAIGDRILTDNKWEPSTDAVKQLRKDGATLWACWVKEMMLDKLGMSESTYGTALSSQDITEKLVHPTYSWSNSTAPLDIQMNSIADVYNEKDPDYYGGNVLTQDINLPDGDGMGAILEAIKSYPHNVNDPASLSMSVFSIPLSAVYNLLSNIGWQSPLTENQPDPMGGNALITTADDFVKFQNFMLTGKNEAGEVLMPYTTDSLVDDQTTPNPADYRKYKVGDDGKWSIQDMTFNWLTDEINQAAWTDGSLGHDTGYGWGINHKVNMNGGVNTNMGTYGWNGMLGSLSLMDPGNKLSITVMCNTATQSELTNNKIFNAVYYDLRKDGIIPYYSAE